MDNTEQKSSDLPDQDKALAREREIADTLRMTYSKNPILRSKASKRLGELRAGVERLSELLKDANSFVRASAATALGFASETNPTTELIEDLLSMIDDPNDRVCAAAINSLGRLSVEGAREQIIPFLDDPNSYVVSAAISALGRLGPPEIGDRLVAYLENTNRYIEMAAVKAIGNLGYQPACKDLLAGMIRVHQSQAYRKDMPKLNSYIEAVIKLNIREAIPVLIEIARQDIGSRSKAVQALVIMDAGEAASILAKMLSDPGEKLRTSLIKLMVASNYVEALPIIRPLLEDRNHNVRRVALYAVTQMEDFASVNQVRWMCNNEPNPFLRASAVNSLFSLIGDQAIPDLIHLADDTNTKVREAVIHNLVKVENLTQEAFAKLITLTQDPVSSVQEAAQQAIMSISLIQSAVPTGEIEKPKTSLLPSEMLSEKPVLIELLTKWQQFLANRYPHIADLDELVKTDHALAHLIRILETAKE